MKTRRSLLLVLVLCSTATAAPSPAEIRASAKVEHAVPPCTEEVDELLEVPGVKVPGTIQAVARWTDARGAHLAIFWTKDTIQNQTECGIETRHMYVDVYDVRSERRTLVRSVREYGKACYDFSETQFDDEIRIDDMDADGLGELMFSYTSGCNEVGRPKPITRKLFVLEGKDKHVLRGIAGGAFKAEGFEQQAVLLTAAKTAWAKLPKTW